MVTAIDRKHDHLLSFISTELGVEGVLGGENNLILQGKFQGKHIERLYKKYMEQYVRCLNANSALLPDQLLLLRLVSTQSKRERERRPDDDHRKDCEIKRKKL
jgi:translation initiation factor 2 beta subunit (eIF-2beta)/eIF-5